MDEWFFFETNNNAEKLRKVMVEHPNLPVIFSCLNENYDSHITDDMKVEVGEVFNSKMYGDDYVFTEREDLEDRLYDEYEELSDTFYEPPIGEEEWVKKEMACSEKYWIPCIIVSVG